MRLSAILDMVVKDFICVINAIKDVQNYLEKNFGFFNESLRKKVQIKEPFDLSVCKKLLKKHKSFEEKHDYPILNQVINEGEPSLITEMINASEIW